jgi:hypothetical protein
MKVMVVKETIHAYLKVLSRQLPGKNRGKPYKPHSGYPVLAKS